MSPNHSSTRTAVAPILPRLLAVAIALACVGCGYLAARELGDITIASIGPQPLTAPQPMVATA